MPDSPTPILGATALAVELASVRQEQSGVALRAVYESHEALRAGLRRYGQHDAVCVQRRYPMRSCDCGFDDALGGVPADG